MDFLGNGFTQQPPQQSQLQAPQRNTVAKGPGGRFISTGNKKQKQNSRLPSHGADLPDLVGAARPQASRAISGKRNKNPRVWTNDHVMLGMGSPELIQSDNRRKKYKISFKYMNKRDGKPHMATVCFGDKDQMDYIDHHDVDKR